MQDFDLSDAVENFTHHSSSIGTLWGIYVAATFAGAGFGISLEENFTYPLAAFLSIGFLAFTIGHWHLLRQHIDIQADLRADILAYLDKAGPDSGPFAKSIRSICRNSSKLGASRLAHIVIDICVLLLVWSLAAGIGPLNSA